VNGKGVTSLNEGVILLSQILVAARHWSRWAGDHPKHAARDLRWYHHKLPINRKTRGRFWRCGEHFAMNGYALALR